MTRLSLIALAAHGVRRHSTRTILTVLGLAALITTYVTVQSLVTTLQVNVTASISSLGGEIDVWSKGAPYPLVSKIPESYTSIVKNVSGVTLAAPVALALLTIDNDEALVTGLVPNQVHSLFNYTMLAGSMIATNQSGVLAVGKSLSQTLRKTAGDHVQLSGANYTVGGVYETNSWLDYSIIIPHLVAQQLVGMQGGTSMIVAVTNDPRSIDTVISHIREALPAVEAFRSSQVPLSVSPILASIQTIASDIIAVVSIAAVLGIMNSNLNSLRERVRTFAIYKSTGASYSQILRLALYESALLGALGTLLGLGVSYLALSFVQVPVTEAVNVGVILLPATFLYAAILGISVSLVSAVYPAFRIARARPQEVFRFG